MLSRRPVAALLVVLALLALVGLGGLGGASGAAAAGAAPLRCERGSLADEAKAARTVFTGTVGSVDREPATGGTIDFLQQVSVDRVYKPGGSAVIDAEEVTVRTQQLEGECSLGELEQGERYVVFATLVDDELVATGESGTTLADAELLTEVESLLGPGRAPVPPEPEEATLSPVAGGEPMTFVRSAVPGAALMVLGLLGLLVVRRLVRGD